MMSEPQKPPSRISTPGTILLFTAFLLSGAVSGLVFWSFANMTPKTKEVSVASSLPQAPDPANAGSVEGELTSSRFDSLDLPAGIKLVLIAADPEDEIDEFFITETEITNAQYDHYLTASKQAARVKAKTGDGDYPVVMLTQYEAQAFCNWLGSAAGLAGRLPREVEWEYAATGLTENRPGFSNSIRHSLPVGQIPAVRSNPQNVSQFGVYDLPGSVWEWTSDEPSPGEAKKVNDGTLDPAELRLVKGGSANEPLKSISPTQREIVRALTKDRALGFRCVAVAPERTKN